MDDTDDAITAAITKAKDLVDDLVTATARGPGETCFVLLTALQLFHAAATPVWRAQIERRLRVVLVRMYEIPPFDPARGLVVQVAPIPPEGGGGR